MSLSDNQLSKTIFNNFQPSHISKKFGFIKQEYLSINQRSCIDRKEDTRQFRFGSYLRQIHEKLT